jgi:hypothetical protein
MVNRMLRNAIPYDKIRAALQEHGLHVTERNISNWKTRGGYEDWCTEQDRALQNHLLQDNLLEHLRKYDGTDLPEIGLQLAATSLSRFFLKPETQQQLATDPEKFTSSVSVIRRLSHHLLTLQKYRDDCARKLGRQLNPHHLRQQAQEHAESTRETYSAAVLPDLPDDPLVPHRNFLPKDWHAQPRD